jgi:hypothetical protein
MKKGITTQKLGTATLGNPPKIPHSLRLGIQPKWVTRPEKWVQRPRATSPKVPEASRNFKPQRDPIILLQGGAASTQLGTEATDVEFCSDPSDLN